MLDRQQCSSSNPCSEHGSGHSGCLSDLKSGQVGSSKYTLLSQAGEALENMYKDMPDDVKSNLKISDSYRPLAIQCKIFDFDKFEKTGKGIKKGTANTAAAKPGTSNHGWGRALDLSGPTAQKWIKENGPKYGWCWGEAKGEPWHFTFCGGGPNRYRLCDTMCKVSVDTSGSTPPPNAPTTTDSKDSSTNTTSTTSSKTDDKKDGSTFGFMGGNALMGFLDTFFPGKKKEEEKDKEKGKEKETVNEQIDRIHEIMKKIL